jgi:hypothetical protein
MNRFDCQTHLAKLCEFDQTTMPLHEEISKKKYFVLISTVCSVMRK